jgi:proteasome lid subunit RPN8/RPN11
LVEDFQLVKQRCTYSYVSFDDASVADLFDTKVGHGLRPDQFARIWIHTHPGASARPSLTDERTFHRVFGNSDWAVMFILAKEGGSYARLRIGQSPHIESKMTVGIDYEQAFAGSNHDEWESEYCANVVEEDCFRIEPSESPRFQRHDTKTMQVASDLRKEAINDEPFIIDEHWPAY